MLLILGHQLNNFELWTTQNCCHDMKKGHSQKQTIARVTNDTNHKGNYLTDWLDHWTGGKVDWGVNFDPGDKLTVGTSCWFTL